jgi:hypothetical protein
MVDQQRISNFSAGIQLVVSVLTFAAARDVLLVNSGISQALEILMLTFN